MNNIKEIIKASNESISINNFINLYNCLKEINDKQKHKKYLEDVKDLIQLIIDYLIYGDTKKEQIYFDNFCELDIMKEFIKASKIKNFEILLQIIKSMSALILTITNQASLYYIFSNNFINKIITNEELSIQESNEDFLTFYVNFLKSLSMKIDSTTIQLFFQKETGTFPLLENSIRFYNCEDSMIRNVVRNIFLKFAKLSQEYKPLREYFLSLPMLKYFCFISCRLTDMTIQLSYFAGYNDLYKYKFGNMNNNKEFIFNYQMFKTLHDDIIDEILYFQDILSINDEQIISAFLNSLLYYYICPLLLGSLYNYKFFFQENKNNNLKYIISPEIALYIFTLIISNIHNDSLLNLICILLFRKEINCDIITKLVNVHQFEKYPIYPNNYFYYYKIQNNKEKNISFAQYITYNFNQKFICSLLIRHNSKYKEIIQLQKKYEKNFEEPDFDPYENYDSIFNDIISKLSKKDKDFMREYHNTISTATGIKCGLSEDEYENNALNILKQEENYVINPIRIIILEKLFKYNDDFINLNVNLLLYSVFYNIANDANSTLFMNKSLSRKLLYYECNLFSYDLFINKNIYNKNKDSDKINVDNFKLFKTENFELKYLIDDVYSKKYNYDSNLINNLINLLCSLNPFCSLEILLVIYNIKYILFPLEKKENENLTKDTKEGCIEFNKEQKLKLYMTLYKYIQKINSLINNNINIKFTAYESLEDIWNIYNNEYSFNSKNSIIKYILSPHYISIPSLSNNIEDYPFKNNSNKYIFNIYLTGFLSLYGLMNINNENNFPIENGNFEYKIGDKIKIENINIHNSKFKILKILLKKRFNNEFEESIIFMNKNCIIFGNEEKDSKDKVNNIKVKYTYPLRELEICLDNSFPNSLQLYFKKNNHIIECESNEKRKEIKAELEQKRNEFRKWEQDTIIKFFADEENKFKESEINDVNNQKIEENSNQEKIELFGWQ